MSAVTLREEFVIAFILDQDKNLAKLTEPLLKSILENEMFNTVSLILQSKLNTPKFLLELDDKYQDLFQDLSMKP
jgi:hypothetical protein